MPRKHLMSWEGPPNFRWVKMHAGVRYRVSCRDLGATVWTKEGSGSLANDWWRKKVEDLHGSSAIGQVLATVEAIPIERLRELRERGEAVQKILAELPFVKADLATAEVEKIVGSAVPSGHEAEKLHEVVARLADSPAVPVDRTFQYQAGRFLTFVRGSVKPMTYRGISDFINRLLAGECPVLTPAMDVALIGPETVEGMFLYLREKELGDVTRKTRWAWFKRLIRYFWESEVATLPRNLDSPALRFKVGTKAIRTWTPADVRQCLDALTPRMRLWALLGLNCGMTNVDIGCLRKDMVQIDKGRLIRKRVKTASHGQVPTVIYPLWPETLELLRSHWSKHPDLALTSTDGTSLYETRFDEKKAAKKDLLALAWKRAKIGIPLKAFRSIAATLIESHESYGRYKAHFLGHSPKSVADKHYAAPSGKLFDQIIDWLHDEIFERKKTEPGEPSQVRC